MRSRERVRQSPCSGDRPAFGHVPRRYAACSSAAPTIATRSHEEPPGVVGESPQHLLHPAAEVVEGGGVVEAEVDEEFEVAGRLFQHVEQVARRHAGVIPADVQQTESKERRDESKGSGSSHASRAGMKAAEPLRATCGRACRRSTAAAAAGGIGGPLVAGARAGCFLRKRGLAPSDVGSHPNRPSRAPAPRRLERRGSAAFNMEPRARSRCTASVPGGVNFATLHNV